MSHKVNLVRVLTAATGNSTPITLGAAYSQLFMTPAEAGAMNGRTYTYNIVDGNDWEIGKGVYTSSGTTLARTTVLASRISGTLGTSRISLSGTAQVRFLESAEDLDGVRGTRAVTGTSDVIANSDQGYAITYSNAASVAVTLAQASASNLFLDGWATTIQNLGAGTVTITPATSTINGGSTLVLPQNMGAFVWSDGTNYHAAFMPVTKPLLAANNLSDLASATTALTNLGGTTVGKALFTAADAAAARAATGAPKGYLFGLTLSNNATDATNSIDIAAGEASDASGNLMVLATGITKALNAAWAVGSANGGLDTGSVANGTYHVWLIQRSDTGVVDVLFSASASAPTMPTNYDRKRRIGSILRASAAIRPFKQTGDYFELVTPVQDVSVTNLGTSKVTYLMSAPIGTLSILRVAITIRNTTSSAGVRVFATDAASGATPYSLIAPATNYFAAGHFDIRADVDGYIAAQADVVSTTFQASLLGWTDRRGRN